MKFFYSFPVSCFKKEYLFVYLLFITCSLSAQEVKLRDLRGIIINQEQSPVESASVCLLKAADSSVVKYEISDKQGSVVFKGLEVNRYLLRITSVGYKSTWYGPFQVTSGSDVIDLGKLKVSLELTGLKEVTIVGNKNYIESKPGKVILNVAASALSAGSTAYDILKAAPGVQMDAEENIRLNGKTNVLVIINGKQTFMERETLNDMLKSTVGDQIDEIELISNPQAKFDAAGSGAVINIKLKKNKNFGTNGNLNTMAGLSGGSKDQELNARGNAGLTLNYRNRKINLFGTYSYADISQSRNILLNRNIDNPEDTEIRVDYFGLTRRLANTYRLGIDVNLSSDHVMGIMFNGSDSRMRINKNNTSSIFNRGTLDSTILTGSDQDRGLKNAVFNVNYKGRLGEKAGNISFDLDYIKYERSSTELLTNNFFDAGYNPYREGLLLSNNSPSGYDVSSVKLDYSVSLTKRSKLEMGLQGSEVKGDSRLDFGRIISGNFYPDAQFINHFIIDEKIGAGYINYDVDFKKASLSLGLRAENTVSKGKSLISGVSNVRDYLNFFPNIQYTHNFNKDNNLLISYSRRISRPGYDNLNPFVAYLDQYSYRSGNPLLKPEFSQLAEITHVYKSKYTATLRAKLIRDLILEINEQDDITQINNVVSRNIERQYLYGLELNAPVEFLSWWNVNLNLQSVYEKYVAKTAGVSFQNTSPSFILSALQSFNFKDNLSAELNGKYESATVYGIYNYEPAYSVDAALAKSFLAKSATLRLRVSDLFNTSANRYSSVYRNLDLRQTEKRDSRLVQLSFSYLFGRRTVKGARKRVTGSEGEQGRIGN